ncbi:MAG: hypothetical protein NTW08_06460 [Gammaproteobacteria bacterium]|nr:hypothetical protein [Gammaproteobacteria bacterium]
MSFASNLEQWRKREWTREQAWLALCAVLLLGILWNGIAACLNPMRASEGEVQVFNDKLLGQPYQMHENLLLTAPYFGVYATAIKEPVVASALDIKVVGILFSNHAASSQVVLRNEAGFDKLYRIGDAVKTGVVIDAIHPDGVVVSNNGKLERLSLPENTLKFDSPAAPLKLTD